MSKKLKNILLALLPFSLVLAAFLYIPSRRHFLLKSLDPSDPIVKSIVDKAIFAEEYYGFCGQTTEVIVFANGDVYVLERRLPPTWEEKYHLKKRISLREIVDIKLSGSIREELYFRVFGKPYEKSEHGDICNFI